MDKVLGSRLAEARKRLNLTQAAMSERTEIPIVSYKKYEGSHSKPGSDALAQFVGSGVNVNWLLTGEGPMFLDDVQPPSPQSGQVDVARLRLAIETVEEGLAATRRTMEPDKKAELVTAVYDLFDEDVSDKARDRVLRLVKSAA